MTERVIFTQQVQNQANISLTGILDGVAQNVAQTAASITMVPGGALFCNTNNLIITLPSTPGAGNVCTIATGTGVTNTLVNAVTIMSQTGNLTIDSANVTVEFKYYNSVIGWIIG